MWICIGVAPSDINQNEGGNYCKCGWYFDCYDSALYSGPLTTTNINSMGQRKEEGEYVHTGDSVGVVVDTAKGEISFVVNGVNIGVAFDGILLDESLVPYIILVCPGDYVELDTTEVK